MPPPPLGTNKTNSDRLKAIEVQTEYIVKSLDKLMQQFETSEKQRIDNWIEYRTQHEKLNYQYEEIDTRVNEIESSNREYKERVDKGFNSIAEHIDSEITKTNGQIEETNKELASISNRLDPLFGSHRILVGVSIFFATSVGALLWGIFTHAIAISFVK